MRLKDIFKITRGTKIVLSITIIVSLVGFLIAYLYYSNQNNQLDPRVKRARQWLNESDKLIGSFEFSKAMQVLDSAMNGFIRVNGYKNSFEIGVIYNNKSSAQLMMALYDSSLLPNEKIRLLNLSRMNADSSLAVYTSWHTRFDGKSDKEITALINQEFPVNHPLFINENINKLILRRSEEIRQALKENKRRISVSYTNIGTICRHTGQPDSALYYFSEAISLWPENLTAINNRRVLIGLEPEKPSVIDQMFPPDKNEN